MRRLVLLGSWIGSSCVLACGPIEVDSPFDDPISDGTVTPPAICTQSFPPLAYTTTPVTPVNE